LYLLILFHFLSSLFLTTYMTNSEEKKSHVSTSPQRGG